MIDLYYWPTPNGWKLTILFEELGIPYNVIPVDINKGEQFEQDFLTIAPNNRMPAVVDSEGADGAPLSLFESGAIMLHYADKHGRLIPDDERGRAEVLQWLFFQMGNVGPMLGQCHHFRNYAPEKLPYAIERYVNETSRLYRVVNKCLADRDGSPETIRLPTWRYFPGCGSGRTRGRTSPTIPTSPSGWSATTRARQSSAAST